MPFESSINSNSTDLTTSKGFTLIELLVVMAIIGVLSALLLSNFIGVRERGVDAGLKNDARQIKTALRLYYNDFQKYPDSNDGIMMGCDSGGEGTCEPSGEFSADNSVYMKNLPAVFSYYSDNPDEFLIKVTLSNVSDADIEASQERCEPSSRGYSEELTETDYFVCED